ncbi:hypothetical protein FVEN_g8090 [Fusarium venenatum]|uniref:Cofilin n=1 Tax=Fusarium venenatum TaxID=56646 RepID=A0A2L2T560_9HYPO|nr:uncharacterized protein FVRRES_04557 [Fusarium venenatum]KAG8353847.1 hypothetical protein FVEN_g8090 [Fusarium venenatum]KAH6991718.1 actin depolymerizing factor [Fusarium venenatum]CEI60121.1 unnamed protein product [Fusarium venenatum]
MASGVGVSPECLEAFLELRVANKHQYIIYKISMENTQFVVDRTSESKDWDDFESDLPDNEPCFAVYNFEFEKTDGEGVDRKFIFVSWSPDDAKIKAKMLYASCRDLLRRALPGVGMEIQGTEKSEVAYEYVLEKARRSH